MWKKVLFAVSTLLGIAGFCLIPYFVGVEKTFEVIGQVGWLCIGLYFLLAMGTQVFPAVGWWLLLRAEGVKVTPLDTIQASVMGFPINFMTPSLYLGSEPLKVYYLAGKTGEPKRKILATVIVSKIQEMVALMVVMIIAAIYFVWNTSLFGGPQEFIIISVTVLLCLGLGALFYAFIGNLKPTVGLINLLARIGVAKRKLARLRSKAREMEQMVHAAFTHRWRRFLLAQAITMLSSICIYLRPIVFVLFLKESMAMPMEHACGIYILTNLVNLMTFIPGSLGLYELGVTGYFHEAGLGDSNGLALTLVNRMADLTFLITGIWLIMHYGLYSVARGKKKVSMQDTVVPDPKEEEPG